MENLINLKLIKILEVLQKILEQIIILIIKIIISEPVQQIVVEVKMKQFLLKKEIVEIKEKMELLLLQK